MANEITDKELAYVLGRVQEKIEKSQSFSSKEADAVEYAAERL